MKHLSLIAILFCSGLLFAQEESHSKKEKKYQRYENGELVEDKYYLEKDGARVAGEDFEMPEMDLKMAEMEKRMDNMRLDMDTRMKSRMSDMDKRMEEMMERSQKMQDDMMKRMDNSMKDMDRSQSLDSSPVTPSKPSKFPMRRA